MSYTRKSWNRWVAFLYIYGIAFFILMIQKTPAIGKWMHKDEHLVTTLIMGQSTASPLADIIQLGFTIGLMVFVHLAVIIISAKIILRRYVKTGGD